MIISFVNFGRSKFVQRTKEITKGMHVGAIIPRYVANAAVQQLSLVDYTIANRVTEDVSTIVSFAYAHDLPALASASVSLLQVFDDFGSCLIAIVVWIVHHTG